MRNFIRNFIINNLDFIVGGAIGGGFVLTAITLNQIFWG